MKFASVALATAALGRHTDLKITIACDNKFVLYLPGQNSIIGPKDGDDGIHYGWANVKTYETKLKGSGPWVLGIEGKDHGVVAGMFAGITINGQPYTATGSASTKFYATETKPDLNWLDTNYDISSWKSGPALTPPDCNSPVWASTDANFWKRLAAQSPEQPIKASWLPGCTSTQNKVFFRLVIDKPPKKCHRNSPSSHGKPPSSHGKKGKRAEE